MLRLQYKKVRVYINAAGNLRWRRRLACTQIIERLFTAEGLRQANANVPMSSVRRLARGQDGRWI